MSRDWADETAKRLLSRDLIQTGICLILGASDTGKTTLVSVLMRHTASSKPVGIIDADIGQSHIGPPTTVGWAFARTSKSEQVELSQLDVGGISFVGDITPTGHLLQLTAAITQCARYVSEAAELIIIDTPGFIYGSAASALWWTVERILQPRLVLAVQRGDELGDIIAGLVSDRVELIKSDPQIPTKSPQERKNYRQNQFGRYFRGSCIYDISLSQVAVQMGRNSISCNLINRLVGLRDEKGVDVAIGSIVDWRKHEDIVVIKAPELNVQQVRCLVVGDVTSDIADE